MTNTLPFSLTNESLTIFVGGLPTTVLAGTVQYNQLREAILKNEWDIIPTLLAPGGALARYLGSEFKVDGTTISYRGVALPASLNGRIQEMANQGLDPSPLLRFYERLHKNPSFRSREQLFDFMQHLDIAIEDDGTFLAYKGINENYTDCHTGTIDNSPGTFHVMERNLISDDPNEACHFGFHVGALSYASTFGPVTMICRVDPADVVCVPYDHSHKKMRVCKYEVVGEWNGQKLNVVDSTDVEDDYEVDLFEGFEWDEDHDEGGDEQDEDLDEDPAPIRTVQPVIRITEDPVDLSGLVKAKDLMERSIEELRRYASGTLKIVGASKIPGGKSALVSKIMKVRRRRSKK